MYGTSFQLISGLKHGLNYDLVVAYLYLIQPNVPI